MRARDAALLVAGVCLILAGTFFLAPDAPKHLTRIEKADRLPVAGR
ncbi:hypothetical protein GGD81_001363 [Rhodobium orientis]|nr:hypothetical protein [Rhodobium orientis]MBB4302336.1 hypothetical protein [Rhodobium orientis]